MDAILCSDKNPIDLFLFASFIQDYNSNKSGHPLFICRLLKT